jgi:hypothetical protein
MTISYTLHFHLAVPDFLSEPWHGEFAQAMDSIDNALWNLVGVAGATVWANSTPYVAGNLVVDPATGRVFICILDHTSAAAPTTFEQDRAAHPGNWATSVLELATQEEAEAGVDNTKFMSPLRTAQAIAIQSPIPGIASEAEALAGTDNTTIMTPLRVNQVAGLTVSAQPGGRLTLSSGNPVMATSVAAGANLFYTPHISRIIPIWGGSGFASIDFWDELIAGLNDTTHNPSALTANKVFDWFVWVDSAPVTIAGAPGTITLSNHGFRAGHVFRLSSTGILPSPLQPNTNYYVISTGLAANTFLFSATKAGTPINVTGGAGVHTLETRRLTHGPAWTNNTTRSAALSRARGIWLNGTAITNGPALERGTYVGTTYNSTANQLAWRFGTTPGQSARFNVWNMYNRVNIGTMVTETIDSWISPSGGEWLMMNGSAENRVEMVQGLPEEAVDVTLLLMFSTDSAAYSAIGLDWQDGESPKTPVIFESSGGSHGLNCRWVGVPPIGFHFWQALEAATGTTTFYGTTPDSSASGITIYTRM